MIIIPMGYSHPHSPFCRPLAAAPQAAQPDRRHPGPVVPSRHNAALPQPLAPSGRGLPLQRGSRCQVPQVGGGSYSPIPAMWLHGSDARGVGLVSAEGRGLNDEGQIGSRCIAGRVRGSLVHIPVHPFLANGCVAGKAWHVHYSPLPRQQA